MAATVQLRIDDQAVSVPSGTTIWDAARQHGIAIPALCHSPRLRPVGVCRLCVVDVVKEAAANVLTNDALDPYGKIPEFNFCAVCIEH